MPGLIRTIGIRELKTHVSAVLREVQETGVKFVVTVHGRPVARIEPVEIEDTVVPKDGMGRTRGALSELSKLDWNDFEAAKKLWEPRPLDDR